MDIDFEELNWHIIGRRRHIVELVQEYKRRFKSVEDYSNIQIWTIIKRKHTQWFDYLLSDTLNK